MHESRLPLHSSRLAAFTKQGGTRVTTRHHHCITRQHYGCKQQWPTFSIICGSTDRVWLNVQQTQTAWWLQAANQTHVYISADRGVSWQPAATVQGQYWSTLFVQNSTGDVFLLGATSGGATGANGIGISRSRDGGRTWMQKVRPAHLHMLLWHHDTAAGRK